MFTWSNGKIPTACETARANSNRYARHRRCAVDSICAAALEAVKTAVVVESLTKCTEEYVFKLHKSDYKSLIEYNTVDYTDFEFTKDEVSRILKHVDDWARLNGFNTDIESNSIWVSWEQVEPCEKK
jgi:hypothetical protein